MGFKKMAILGAGTMGRGIAEMLAMKGFEVKLYDSSLERLKDSLPLIEQRLDKHISRWSMTLAEKKLILSRLLIVEHIEYLSDCDFAIECITEQLDLKKELIQQLDRLLAPDAIIASNTASLSLTELAGGLEHPERTIGFHFLYPAEITHFVEIVRGLRTSDKTFKRVKHFSEAQLEKRSIQVYESPGYVTTRLSCILINEAMHTLAEGVATAEDIDCAMRMGYEFRYGPLEMADRFGLDSVLASMESLFREYGDMKYRPSILLKKMVRAGHLGEKTGVGFFKYNDQGEKI